jgi:hypothetical protein
MWQFYGRLLLFSAVGFETSIEKTGIPSLPQGYVDHVGIVSDGWIGNNPLNIITKTCGHSFSFLNGSETGRGLRRESACWLANFPCSSFFLVWS